MDPHCAQQPLCLVLMVSLKDQQVAPVTRPGERWAQHWICAGNSPSAKPQDLQAFPFHSLWKHS